MVWWSSIAAFHSFWEASDPVTCSASKAGSTFFSEVFSEVLERTFPTIKHGNNNIFYKMAPLFILEETSAGLALFKAKDKKLLKRGDWSAEEETAESVNEL